MPRPIKTIPLALGKYRRPVALSRDLKTGIELRFRGSKYGSDQFTSSASGHLGQGNNEKEGAVNAPRPLYITGQQPSVRYPPRRNTCRVKECSILLAAMRIVKLRLCLQ